LADTAPVLIWVNGLEGCEFVNREYLQFLGRTMEEVQGMDWTAALHPDDAAAYLEAYREALEERTPFEAQFRFRREDGEYRWMKSAGLPRFAANGRFLGVVGCSLDITDIKRSEEALAEADRRKNEFLAMLAHELRNPLAPIRNALEILRLSQVGDECPVTKSEKDDLIGKAASSRVTSQDLTTAIEMMDRQINQMVRLVDDLLDVSRISRGQIQLRTGPIDLSSLVNHAVETVRPLCESKGLNLTVALPPEPVFLNADPIRLAQVVGNILSNACKFTNPGGSIELMASVEGRVGGEKKEEGDNGDETLSTSRVSGDAGRQLATDSSSLVTISVRDNGIGIAADQLPRIFEMFAQIDTSLERTRSGLGIGLTLAKKLVELHGGELEGRSAGLGQGSEFVVRLPVVDWRVASEEKAQPDGDTLSTLHPPPATKRRILIVDDNVDSAESLTILLALEGNETHTAYDGLDALAAAASFRPDVILLDIGLPELNGYDVARRIREQPWGRHIMLVALTGWGQEEDRRRSHEAGFDYHLTKPVDPMSLKELLQGGGSS
ncbi:MAG TPA: ATP-binding protein, partial [Terriglobia bacterium]|nr:ATP-binding protein [Terriglobia bacterium]